MLFMRRAWFLVMALLCAACMSGSAASGTGRLVPAPAVDVEAGARTSDIAVLAGLQRGLHQPGFTHLTLSNEERRVINMHRNLERYLHLPQSERMTGGETP